MTELSAAVGIEQLKKIDQHVTQREKLAQRLSEGMEGLEGIMPPVVRPNCRHVYYVWAMRFNASLVGVTREEFSRALTAEGFPHSTGYVRPLYLLPVFQNRVAFGPNGDPFDRTATRYEKGMCPVAERMYEEELVCFEPCMYEVDSERMDLLVRAVRKVYDHREELAHRADV